MSLESGLVVRLRRRFGAVPVIGVDDDQEVLALARSSFGLERAGLEIVQADAFSYLETCRERFDYVCVDLFRGGQFERAAVGRPFLRRLKARATPRAEIVINLFRDRRVDTYITRIERVLTVRSTRIIGRNLVLRTTP